MKSATPSPEDRELLRRLMDAETRHHIPGPLMDRFIDLGRIVEYANGETIVAEGDVNTHLYILMEGIIRSWFWDGEDEKTSFFAMPGTLMVSYAGLLLGEPSSNNYETCSPCRLLRVAKTDYMALIESSHELSRWFLSNAQVQLYLNERRPKLLTGSARDRYQRLERDRPEILRSVPMKIIASYLGVTPQYLSRLRRESR